MDKKTKIQIYIFAAVDAVLVLFCFWQILAPHFRFGDFLLFDPQGIISAQQRHLMLVAFLIMLIGAVPVYFFIFFFAWKYRADKPDAKYSPNLESNSISWLIVWVIPAGVIFTLSFLNWQSTHALDPYKPLVSNNAPITIEVVALEWKFLFIYPAQNIATINFIEFPVNTPVHFELTADAPMSSFWIPQLGSQIYAMAAMQTQLNLMANKTGDFSGYDTEINGAGFSGMKFIARSASNADFVAWLQSVKESSGIMNLNVYNQLAEPSQNNPPAYYASVDKGLYNEVMMKNMMPMTPEQEQQMAEMGDMGTSTMDGISGMNSTSSMPGMQGMYMGQ